MITVLGRDGTPLIDEDGKILVFTGPADLMSTVRNMGVDTPRTYPVSANILSGTLERQRAFAALIPHEQVEVMDEDASRTGERTRSYHVSAVIEGTLLARQRTEDTLRRMLQSDYTMRSAHQRQNGGGIFDSFRNLFTRRLGAMTNAAAPRPSPLLGMTIVPNPAIPPGVIVATPPPVPAMLLPDAPSRLRNVRLFERTLDGLNSELDARIDTAMTRAAQTYIDRFLDPQAGGVFTSGGLVDGTHRRAAALAQERSPQELHGHTVNTQTRMVSWGRPGEPNYSSVSFEALCEQAGMSDAASAGPLEIEWDIRYRAWILHSMVTGESRMLRFADNAVTSEPYPPAQRYSRSDPDHQIGRLSSGSRVADMLRRAGPTPSTRTASTNPTPVQLPKQVPEVKPATPFPRARIVNRRKP